MDYLTYTETIDYLLEMIEKEQLTSLRQAAEKFDCTQSTIKRMLNSRLHSFIFQNNKLFVLKL